MESWCNITMGRFIDITGDTFGDWLAIEYLGNSMWLCENSNTGEIKAIHSYSLRTKGTLKITEFKGDEA
jgi:hypothetical protein